MQLILNLSYNNDLKAQLQDKGIAISELKKLIEKLKGKYVDTKFGKSSVIRQPNAFKSQRPSVLGKPTTFSNSFIRKDFSKSTSVTKNNVSNDFSKPVTAQTLPTKKKSCLNNTNVLAPGMYKLHTDHTQARTSKLPQDSKRTNKRILNAKTLNVKFVSTMCDKCVMIDKHDLCVSKSVAKTLKKTVASESNKKPRNNVRKLHEHFGKIYKWSYIKFTPSGYIWKPKSQKGNVNPNVRVIPTTSVSRPQLKSNPMGDRVLRSNSRGKKLKVEEHRRNIKFPKNKTSVTACNDSLNAKTLNVKSVSAMCDKCVMIDKHNLCVLNSVAKPLKKTVASESNKKPRNNVRKLYERVSKTCSWWYSKFTPSGYIWKPKSGKEHVNPNASMPLGNVSRTVNVQDTMTYRRSIVSNTPLSFNSFAAHRDCHIHRRLWVLKAHDGKSQA
nr:hypothetical protein [Tanacetum cinerariifolium]